MTTTTTENPTEVKLCYCEMIHIYITLYPIENSHASKQAYTLYICSRSNVTYKLYKRIYTQTHNTAQHQEYIFIFLNFPSREWLCLRECMCVLSEFVSLLSLKNNKLYEFQDRTIIITSCECAFLCYICTHIERSQSHTQTHRDGERETHSHTHTVTRTHTHSYTMTRTHNAANTETWMKEEEEK